MTQLRVRVAMGWFLVFVSASAASASPIVLPIGGAVTPTSLANSLLAGSSGITINNVTYTGVNIASGQFTNGAGSIGIDTGILLTSGSVNNVVGPNNQPGATTSNNLAGDAALSALAGQATFDASILTIDFTPTGNSLQFNYVFGSEEYPEFVNQFNDVFALFVNGTNFALVPGTGTPVSINTVNDFVNSAFFVSNTSGVRDTQLDGFTTVLSLVAPVNPNVQNTLRIAIADSGDFILDSAVFLQAGSLQVCGTPGQPTCLVAPAVPEPATLLLLGAGLLGLHARRRRS